jgi:hypothetical protein
MCLEIFIASNKPLPLIPWNDEAPTFHVIDLFDDAEAVRNHFNEPFVYYAGAFEGCGCAFNYDAEVAEPDELKASEQSLNSLVVYLENSLSNGATIKLFSCWAGDENKSPESFRTVAPKEIQKADFVFETPELLTIETGG